MNKKFEDCTDQELMMVAMSVVLGQLVSQRDKSQDSPEKIVFYHTINNLAKELTSRVQDELAKE